MRFSNYHPFKPWNEQRKLGKRRWIFRYVLLNFAIVSIVQVATSLLFHLISGHRPLLSLVDWLPFPFIWCLISWGLGTGQWHDNEYNFNNPQPPSA
jgi:hypothetical protein